MMGKRLLCQEETLTIPSFRKEDECLAGVSVQVQAQAFHQLQLWTRDQNKTRDTWSSLSFGTGSMK